MDVDKIDQGSRKKSCSKKVRKCKSGSEVYINPRARNRTCKLATSSNSSDHSKLGVEQQNNREPHTARSVRHHRMKECIHKISPHQKKTDMRDNTSKIIATNSNTISTPRTVRQCRLLETIKDSSNDKECRMKLDKEVVNRFVNFNNGNPIHI